MCLNACRVKRVLEKISVRLLFILSDLSDYFLLLVR